MAGDRLFDFWLSIKLVRGGGKFLGLTAVLSLVGLVLGVGVLIATMAVVSGFERTIKDSVIDLSGHVVLLKRGTYIDNLEALKENVKKMSPPDVKMSPFLHLEAMLPVKGKVSGVVVQGIDKENASRIPLLQKRVVKGSWNIAERNVMIGKEIAKRMGIEPGDRIKIVVPRPSNTNSENFSPKLTAVKVAGLIDLGKFDFNDRVILASNRTAQKMIGLKAGAYSGLRLMLEDADKAPSLSHKIAGGLGYPYYSKSWYELNQNFFEALKIEKRVIFLVLSVMILAASFNTASSLFVSVVKRYSEISVLKALGAGPSYILKIFSIQGILIGFVGTLLGILFGFGLIFILQNYSLVDIPADIYKIDKLPIDIRTIDVVLVGCISFVFSFVASLIPALKGASLSPMEGLRYE